MLVTTLPNKVNRVLGPRMLITGLPLLLLSVVVGRSVAGQSAVSLDLEQEAQAQYETLLDDLNEIERFERYAEETYHPEALVKRSDRDPLDVLVRRTRALLDDIQGRFAAPELKELSAKFAALSERATLVDAGEKPRRRKLFGELFLLRRKIAFSNPLLDFDKLLFLKRDRATYDHMCDQYYGTNAAPGGGVYLLSDPFSDAPTSTDLLANTVVTSGRLASTSLVNGSFLSPEISYDGKSVMFAYVECVGDPSHVTHLDHANNGHWDRGRCYHLFSMNVDSESLETSNLRQLTDGTFNDFDPCYLPNGRVAFISERRGGYLRCGRDCPSYTVHDMKPDGSDIRILSPHENNEWHPSVTDDGMLLYTRWDYVDRHGCTAHHPWIMTPDGRDSRAIHGNFSTKKERADMEMDLRQISGSAKIIGTAAPHHGQAYGSIIIVDPNIPDDDAMAPVRRVTPDVGFPESQNGAQVYGTPWPLSENYFLCVYDAKMAKGTGKHNKPEGPGQYGVYLLDAFGNKILLYRDPAIACLSPMPLRARTKPLVVADQSARLASDPPTEGTMAIIDVYDSMLAWPEGTKISALRIYQIYPSSTPSAVGLSPHQLGRRIAEAADSNNLARSVLGTVPVEKDGSAYFTLPALKEVYFQALDEKGLAVQSMRSATWVQPGERLLCYGCHEPKQRAPQMPEQTPLALLREPSVPTPDVDGTHPFSYPRLVQPVLDAKCVSCHAESLDQGAPPLDRQLVQANLTANKNLSKLTTVYRSYDSLVHDYAFWSYGDVYRTRPGQFGARASELYKLLSAGHHDVELSEDEMHRITVWLDSLSNFYGVYEEEGGKIQLKGGVAHPTLQ
ncbi:HzsA-related protein [Novipirellula artificiosorum]|uniref:Hydrazine synthase alpha subunit middle domain-containing protein n=1 Tax=Novipirellula artificiosorum TaxID=2528016 RepID=A0A5C6D8V9_9BACT|nr:hypothetical protein [Novipirellula artificiosorum]TWU33280.1 hypothetical protein Poly41_50320 [Novipirellula artificiosorum]